MIFFVGANGIAAWNVRTRKGEHRRIVCLNDGFSVVFDDLGSPNARAIFQAMREHSEALNGRTLSLSEISGLE